jgi:hypothetical protein
VVQPLTEAGYSLKQIQQLGTNEFIES